MIVSRSLTDILLILSQGEGFVCLFASFCFLSWNINRSVKETSSLFFWSGGLFLFYTSVVKLMVLQCLDFRGSMTRCNFQFERSMRTDDKDKWLFQINPCCFYTGEYSFNYVLLMEKIHEGLVISHILRVCYSDCSFSELANVFNFNILNNKTKCDYMRDLTTVKKRKYWFLYSAWKLKRNKESPLKCFQTLSLTQSLMKTK